MKRYAVLLWAIVCALPAFGQSVGIGIGANQLVGKQVTFGDGAILIGRDEAGNAVNNYLSLNNAVMQTASGVWTLAATVIIDAENGSSADQTLVSKAAAANYEYRIWWDRSVTKWKCTIYDATGASSATAVSSATTAIGATAHICAGYNGTTVWISVEGEAAQTAAVAFSPGSGTAVWRLGSWPIATSNLNGRVDSVGWFKGYTFSSGNIATYAAGVRWEDIGSLQSSATAWWDFGNLTKNATGYDPTNGSFNRNNLTEWDWLLDSQSGSYTLTQSVATGTKYPWVVRGIVAPLSQSATTKKVFIARRT